MASLFTSIIGGIQSRSAATNAANAQMRAAQGAGDLVGQATADNIGIIGEGYDAAAAGVRGAAEQAGNWGSEAARLAASQAAQTAAGAGAGVTDAARQANALLDPFLTSGRDAVGRFGDILTRLDQFSQAKPMSAADLEMDPGYQFRLAEAQKTIERSAASRGALQGGATMKALTRFSQDAASQEFQNMFNRNLASRNQQLQGMTAQLNTLGDLTRMGYSAAGAQGQNLTGAATYTGDAARQAAQFGGQAIMTGDMYAGDKLMGGATYAGNAGIRSADMRFGALMDAARYKGDMMMKKGDAEASGHLGRANAWNSMLGGIGSAANSLLAGGFQSGNGFSFGDMMKYGLGGGRRP